jgi:hypothetical protein
MKSLHILAIAAVAGCATTNEAELVASLEPCTVADTSTGPHFTVRGDGFNFCVPQGWVPQHARSSDGEDARTWRNGDQTVTWNIGGAATDAGGARMPFTVQRAQGTTGSALPVTPANLEEFSETIGGYPARLMIIGSGGTYRTGATWESPIPLRLSGEAGSRAEALAQLAAYRTVRFPR